MNTILFVGFYYSYRLFRLHWNVNGSSCFWVVTDIDWAIYVSVCTFVCPVFYDDLHKITICKFLRTTKHNKPHFLSCCFNICDFLLFFQESNVGRCFSRNTNIINRLSCIQLAYQLTRPGLSIVMKILLWIL